MSLQLHPVPPRSSADGSTAYTASLAVMDSLFPCTLSGFLYAEYSWILQQMPTAEVWTTGEYLKALDAHTEFGTVLADFQRAQPDLSRRVRPFARLDHERRISADFGYAVFLNQAYSFLPHFERANIPFAFTLYPGGGFQLDQYESDYKLREVCSSLYFRKMIVTQHVTYDYVLKHGFCAEDQIAFIHGVAIPPRELVVDVHRQEYGKEKQTLDVCFVAHKYMPGGIDKGYDVFVQIAAQLAQRHPQVRFHVAGGFSKKDLPLGDLEPLFQFHGSLPHGEMFQFFASMDAIVSPNVPFLLVPGGFDGFPTGCCTHAGLAGTAVFCTDAMLENRYLQHGEEIVVIPHDATGAANQISSYLADPARLQRLGRDGQRAFRRHYSIARQLEARVAVLQACMSQEASDRQFPKSGRSLRASNG